jgi:hypothetical protein
MPRRANSICVGLLANPVLYRLPSLRLIFGRVRQWTYVVQNLAKVATVYPSATVAPNEMLGFIRWLSVDALANVFSARDFPDHLKAPRQRALSFHTNF